MTQLQQMLMKARIDAGHDHLRMSHEVGCEDQTLYDIEIGKEQLTIGVATGLVLKYDLDPMDLSIVASGTRVKYELGLIEIQKGA